MILESYSIRSDSLFIIVDKGLFCYQQKIFQIFNLQWIWMQVKLLIYL